MKAIFGSLAGALLLAASSPAPAADACRTRVLEGVQCVHETAPGQARGVADFLTIGRYVLEAAAGTPAADCAADGTEHTTATFVQHCWGCGQGGTYLWASAASASLDAAAGVATADFDDAEPDNIIWGIGRVGIPLAPSAPVTVAYVYGDVSQQHRREAMACRALHDEVIPGWQL
jgi:hypothetical protein